MGKGSHRRPTLTSKEEQDLRWDYAEGKLNISEKEMKKQIKEIRERTEKP